MKYYGTKNNKNYGFYLENFEGAIEITDEYWDNLLNEQSKGKQIILVADKVLAVKPLEYEFKNNIWTKLTTKEITSKQLKIENEIKANEIKNQLADLDVKRIRAVCEPTLINEAEGITWLEHYNNKIKILREELSTLKA